MFRTHFVIYNDPRRVDVWLPAVGALTQSMVHMMQLDWKYESKIISLYIFLRVIYLVVPIDTWSFRLGSWDSHFNKVGSSIRHRNSHRLRNALNEKIFDKNLRVFRNYNYESNVNLSRWIGSWNWKWDNACANAQSHCGHKIVIITDSIRSSQRPNGLSFNWNRFVRAIVSSTKMGGRVKMISIFSAVDLLLRK